MTETKTHVILLSCGSFNPITRGHVHMFGEEGGGGTRSKRPACLRLSCHVFDPNLNTFRFGVKRPRGRREKRERALPRQHAQSHSNGRIPSSADNIRRSMTTTAVITAVITAGAVS